jgi:hypothetical protein
MMEAISFSDTSVLARAIRRNIPEDAILQLFDSREFALVIIFVQHFWKSCRFVALFGTVICTLGDTNTFPVLSSPLAYA